MDYDDLYTTRAGELAWWAGLPDTHLNTLAELRAATGQELHGFNLAPGFANAAAGDYTLASTSGLIDKGLVIPGINGGYGGAAPDPGAFEFTPALTLRGAAGDQTIRLTWTVNTTLPATSTWQIAYTGGPGIPPSPIAGVISPTRAYTLTGLTNYTWYTITLNAMLDSTPIMTDTAMVMPTDRLIFLPVILQAP
jgi:hypothetical protein